MKFNIKVLIISELNYFLLYEFENIESLFIDVIKRNI